MVDRDLAYFQSIPWCVALLNDPQYVITPTYSREAKADTEDSLFAETLKTDQTFSACLSLYRKPETLYTRVEEVKTLLAVGSGVNGYPHVCHGGVVATMLDEVMSVLLVVMGDREEAMAKATGGSFERAPTFTAELAVKYLKPIATPQILCVTARISKIQGRKLWIKGTIEDRSGTILATGEAMFVQKPDVKI